MCERLLTADLPVVPIDRGWAWIIAISSFLMLILTAGSLKAYGVLYAELVSYSPQDAHKIIGLHAMVLTMPLLSAIGVLLSDRYGFRVALIVGSLATSIGYVSSAFVATSVPGLMYLTYSLIAGTGYNIIHICTVTVLTQYFTDHLAFALGFSQSGTSAGFFVWPYLFRVLFDSYGIQGTLMLCGAITLNACCLSALIRPVSFYKNVELSLVPNYGCNKNAKNSSRKSRGNSRLEMRRDVKNKVPLLSDDSVDGNIQTDGINDLKTSFFEKDFKRKVAENISKLWIIVTNPIFVAYIVSSLLQMASVYPSLVIIPAYAIEIDLSEYDIATIMTVFGAAEFVGRIAIAGALANISFFDKKRTLICGTISTIFGVSAILVTVHASFAGLVVHAMITGSMGMSTISLQPIMFRDAFGVELFSTFYTLFVSFTAPSPVISVYICQAFQTVTGSWAWPIRCTGIFGLAAGVPLLVEFLNRKISRGTGYHEK